MTYRRREIVRSKPGRFWVNDSSGTRESGGPYRTIGAAKRQIDIDIDGEAAHTDISQWGYNDPDVFSNPPSCFIPCKAVKITRNRGRLEVRIKR